MTRGAVEIRVGLGSCGMASGAEPVRDALERAAKQAGANGIVKTVGCNGMCHREPLVEVVEVDGAVALYGNVTAETARQIAQRRADNCFLEIEDLQRAQKLTDQQLRTRWKPAFLQLLRQYHPSHREIFRDDLLCYY